MLVSLYHQVYDALLLIGFVVAIALRPASLPNGSYPTESSSACSYRLLVELFRERNGHEVHAS